MKKKPSLPFRFRKKKGTDSTCFQKRSLNPGTLFSPPRKRSNDADYIDDPVLKDMVKNAKIGEKRNKLMKGASKEMRELAKEYALNKATLNLLKDGTFAPEKIAEVLEIPLEKVLDIKQRAGL